MHIDEGMARRIQAHLRSPAIEDGDVHVVRMKARERIGGIYEFEIDIAGATGRRYDSESVTGAPAALVLAEEQGTVRTVHGLIRRMSDWLDDEARVPFYRLSLVPRAHLLNMVHTQEVFLDMSIPEVIEAKLKLLELPYRLDLASSYSKREIVVQYAETDLDFIARLCEHHGISFFFVQKDDEEEIVFVDAQRFAGLDKERDDIALVLGGDPTDVYRLERVVDLIPRHYMVSDYNYRTPLVDVAALAESGVGAGGGVIEHGTHMKTPGEAMAFAKLRREEHECRRVVYRGTSDRCDLAPGVVFTLVHPDYGDKKLLVVEAEHELLQIATHGAGTDNVHRYENKFVAVEAELPFRPARTTPRPRIHGIVHATVMPSPGSDGTQPWLDESGRYVVRLLFDTAGHDGKASHAVRMAQQHAGPDYGTHFPLRPGVEVLLAFIDGDPDRPIIVGAVPNAVTPSPVLDKEALHHRIKTPSGILIEFEDGF